LRGSLHCHRQLRHDEVLADRGDFPRRSASAIVGILFARRDEVSPKCGIP
jgi:hypothetical protein